MANQKVELSPFWDLLLKLNLTVVPILVSCLIAWAVWVTSELWANKYFRQSTERVDKSQLRQIENKAELNSLRLSLLSEGYREVKDELKEINKKLDEKN